jgi:Uma2 family endonuclease
MAAMFPGLDPSIPRHRLTIDEVQRMVESGILAEDAAVELLEGELVAVTPQGPAHATGKAVLGALLRRAYVDACVRDQDPLECGVFSLPEPDLAVVRGHAQDYAARHPRGDEALLVVEVCRTSQKVDHSKSTLYAAAGVPEYWIVDLLARCITIHREPSGAEYSVREIRSETDAIELPGGVRFGVSNVMF